MSRKGCSLVGSLKAYLTHSQDQAPHRIDITTFSYYVVAMVMLTFHVIAS